MKCIHHWRCYATDKGVSKMICLKCDAEKWVANNPPTKDPFRKKPIYMDRAEDRPVVGYSEFGNWVERMNR